VGSDDRPLVFVPDSFAVPRELVTEEFRLEPLGPEHNEGDYEAWTSSIDHIQATPGFEDASASPGSGGGTWPDPGMTPEENLVDLRRHAEDFAHRSGFTYTVRGRGSDRIIGCVYIYPWATRMARQRSVPGSGQTRPISTQRFMMPWRPGCEVPGPSPRSASHPVCLHLIDTDCE